jgi:hypothetical protein
MPPQKSEFDAHMHHLEAEIRRLEGEYNMFFAGRLTRPPFETKNRVAALIKRHDQSFIRNTADRFRFESLQNRYQKFIELVERQMTNRELGRPTLGVKPPKPAEPQPEAKPADAQAGGAAATAAGDAAKSGTPAADAPRVAASKEPKEKVAAQVVRIEKGGDAEARARELYEKLAAAKQQAGEKPVALERIQALVKQQVDKFKSEGKEVSFKVAMKDGKVTLTAKVADDKD